MVDLIKERRKMNKTSRSDANKKILETNQTILALQQLAELRRKTKRIKKSLTEEFFEEVHIV